MQPIDQNSVSETKDCLSSPQQTMAFLGHPATPLNTLQENPPYPMPNPFYPMHFTQQFDLSQMNAMCMMPMGPMAWCPTTPSSSNGTNLSTPSSTDSGVSSADGSPPSSDPSEVFSRVQGRLNLVNNLRDYDVTRGEIERRLGYPECMNSSTIAAYLRKAKVKESGLQMRKEMEKKGIRMPGSRRKGAALTAFSALIEDEALVMARNMQQLAEKHFPVEAIACHFASSAMYSAEEIQELHKEAIYAARFLNRIKDLSDKVPVSVGSLSAPPPSDPVSEGMNLFSTLSHGFGWIDHKTWLDVFAKISNCVALQTQYPS